jgi:hypothetical protein
MDVQGFDSTEAVFAEMHVAEAAANERLTPGQVRLRDNVAETTYWAHAIPDWDLVIYGQAPPNAETQKGAGFDVNENRARGYLTGIAFSRDTGEHGESGDTHVSQVIPINRTTFLLAKMLGWPSFSDLRTDENNLVLAALLAVQEREMFGRV